MAQNIEIKARANNFARQLSLATELSDQSLEVLKQVDTFFRVPHGRLKLREFPDQAAQLIFYHRPDTDGPKLSEYQITKTEDPQGLKGVLGKAYGVQQTVKKVRNLLMLGRTRLHFDIVEDLGEFIELEVVLGDTDAIEAGQEEAQKLMNALEIDQSDLIDVAYADLLQQKAAS